MPDTHHQLSEAQHTDVRNCTSAACVPEPYDSQWSSAEGICDELLIKTICYLDRIDSGAATRAELAETLDVSSTTVRRATDALEADGVLVSLAVGNVTVYWLRHPHSDWPVQQDVSLNTDEPFTAGAASGWAVLRGDPPVMCGHLAVAGAYIGGVQATIGGVAIWLGWAAVATALVHAGLATVALSLIFAATLYAKKKTAPGHRRPG